MKNKREYINSKIVERWNQIWSMSDGLRFMNEKVEEEYDNHLRELKTFYDDLLETYKK